MLGVLDNLNHMGIKWIKIGFIFALMTVISGIAFSFISDSSRALSFVSKVTNGVKKLGLSRKIEQSTTTRKTYIDERHGFSFEYPDEWGEILNTEVTLGDSEPSGISVLPFEVKNCTTADNYFQEEVLPYYANIRRVNISNPNLDGFVVEDHHLDNVTPGPEAYIMNCPYVIRLGCNSVGIDEGEKVFDQIIASFKTWQPPN